MLHARVLLLAATLPGGQARARQADDARARVLHGAGVVHCQAGDGTGRS